MNIEQQKKIVFYKLLEEACFGTGKLTKKQGEILYSHINGENAGMTVCPECHVDDFTHFEGCKLSDIPLSKIKLIGAYEATPTRERGEK